MEMNKNESKVSSIQELLMNILVRVDSKSLLRFRCVSKTWCHIIHDPKFAIMQLCFHQNNNSNNHRGENINIITLEDEKFTPNRGRKFMLRCFNGKLLNSTAEEFTPCTSLSPGFLTYPVCGCVHGLFLLGLCQYYILWNPFTGKSMRLPLHPLFHDPKNGGEYGESITEYTLGFDSSSGDFKVVALRSDVCLDQPRKTVIGIFSCNTGCWRTCSFDFEKNWVSNDLKIDQRQRSVFAMGAVNWLGYDMVLKKSTHIVSFDLSSETLKCIALPGANDDGDYMGLRLYFVMGESLAVFDVSQTRSCIWVMKKGVDGEGKSSWSKWYLNDLAEVDIERYEFFKSVCKSTCYNLLFLEKSRKFLVGVHGRVYSYDIDSHERNLLEKSKHCRINYMDFLRGELGIVRKRSNSGQNLVVTVAMTKVQYGWPSRASTSKGITTEELIHAILLK